MSKKRILVIDDDQNIRAMLCDNLKDCGYDAYCAENGEDGLFEIEADVAPHLVVTDIMMPKKEGLEVIMEIRKKFPGLKVVAISGGGRGQGGDFLTVAGHLGADAALRKPINMTELERTIERLIGEA